MGIIVIIESIINDNPGDCADKVEDALESAYTALDEIDKNPPDRQAALGNIEEVVGYLDAALEDDYCSDPSELTNLMVDLAGIARAETLQAIEEAIAGGGDSGVSFLEGLQVLRCG